MRLQFVPGREPPALLDLPWQLPVGEWPAGSVVRMAHGLSRHVVRFVRAADRVYALKEMSEREATHEYGMLRMLAQEGLPVVEAVGLATRRAGDDGEPLDAVLVTRYLDYSLPFHYVFGGGTDAGSALWAKLIDAGVVLLVRLHLDGFFWGDCSLSNLLFRRDTGSLMAYLVDAETAEHYESL
ncbi:MAG: lipopolysaccharide kinase InaA family protein, partial [Acidimicrobiia bacterium]